MKTLFATVLFLAIAVTGLSAADSRVPVMVLPFENKTEIKTLDRFTGWIKEELANYGNIRIIDFYKSTNINGTLLLFLKPTQEFIFGKNKNTGTAQNIPDTYYIVTGTITYADFRYNIHADVINSTTEWIIAKDDVYISDVANIRKLLVQELGRRLTLKMSFKQVSVFNEQKVLAAVTNTNTNQNNVALTNAAVTNKQSAPVVVQPQPVLPPPIEQQNIYNEKKQVMIVFNTNERKVLEDLKKKQTNAIVQTEDTNVRGYRRPEKTRRASVEGEKSEFGFYNSPFKNEIAFQPLISGDYQLNSNKTFTSYELGYKFQIATSFYIGVNLGFGVFDQKGFDSNSVQYEFSVYEYRIVPEVLYRWFFVQPFFMDIGVGFGGHFGNAVLKYIQDTNATSFPSYATNDSTTDGLAGYVLQGRVGAGVELGRFTLGIYFAVEGQMINYTEQAAFSSFVFMTTIGLSAGVEF